MIKKLMYRMHVIKKLEHWVYYNGSLSYGGAFAVWRKRFLRYCMIEYIRHYKGAYITGEALCLKVFSKRFLLCYG